jgi:hypothetical protein
LLISRPYNFTVEQLTLNSYREVGIDTQVEIDSEILKEETLLLIATQSYLLI